MQVSSDHRRELVDIALVQERILKVLAWPGTDCRSRVDHVYGATGVIQLSGVGAADRAGPDDQDVDIEVRWIGTSSGGVMLNHGGGFSNGKEHHPGGLVRPRSHL